MVLYNEYEQTVKKLFSDHDEAIAKILKNALKNGAGKDQNIFSALAWASGNMGSKFPKTSEVLFEFVQVMKNRE